MHTASPRLAAFAACLSLGLVIGCKAKEGGAGSTSGATTPVVGATTATVGGTSGGTVAPGGGAKMSDGNIVALFDEANIADSASGSAALPKATRADVKAFARMMMSEHHALRVKGMELARKPTGALPPWPKAEPPATDPFSAAVNDEKDALSSTPKGRAFDSTYIAKEIGIHQAVIDWATSAEAQAQNQELKGLIQSSGPVIKRHLERAQAIAAKMASSTSTKAPATKTP